MSWKIYNGLRIKARTIYDSQQIIKEIRPVAKKHLIDFNSKLVASKAFKDYDLISLGIKEEDDDKSKNILMNAFHLIIFDEEYHDSIKLDNKYFIGFAAISKNARYILAIPFLGSNPNLEFIINDHPLIEDYPYWDNTDRDDKLTAAEWNKRKRDWSAAFGDNDGVPNNQMFMHQIVDRTLCIPTFDNIRESTPTLTERYADCVEIIIGHNAREQYNEKYNNEDFNFYKFIKFYNNYKKENFESILTSIDGKLDENLTIDILKETNNGS